MAAPRGIEPVNGMSAASLHEEPASILYNLVVVDQPAFSAKELSQLTETRLDLATNFS